MWKFEVWSSYRSHSGHPSDSSGRSTVETMVLFSLSTLHRVSMVRELGSQGLGCEERGSCSCQPTGSSHGRNWLPGSARFLSVTCLCVCHIIVMPWSPRTSYGIKLFLITLNVITRVSIEIKYKLTAILSHDFPLMFLCLASILNRKYAWFSFLV